MTELITTFIDPQIAGREVGRLVRPLSSAVEPGVVNALGSRCFQRAVFLPAPASVIMPMSA